MRILENSRNFIFSLIATLVCLFVLLNIVGMSQFYSHVVTFATTLVVAVFVALLQFLPVFFSQEKVNPTVVAK